jgi:hypothetical protein
MKDSSTLSSFSPEPSCSVYRCRSTPHLRSLRSEVKSQQPLSQAVADSYPHLTQIFMLNACYLRTVDAFQRNCSRVSTPYIVISTIDLHTLSESSHLHYLQVGQNGSFRGLHQIDTRDHRDNHQPIPQIPHHQLRRRTDLTLTTRLRPSRGCRTIGQTTIDIADLRSIPPDHRPNRRRIDRYPIHSPIGDLLRQERAVIDGVAATHLIPLTQTRHVARSVLAVQIIVIAQRVRVRIDRSKQKDPRENRESRQWQRIRQNTSRRTLCASGIRHRRATGVSIAIRWPRARARDRSSA